MIALLLFLLLGAALAALLWSGYELFVNQEDPLGDRLEVLQEHAMAGPTASSRRRGGGGFLNSFLYVISLVPGGEGWLRDTERELAQAGVRRRQAIAYYTMFQLVFLIGLAGLMAYLQRNNEFAQQFGGMVSALLLGWLLPQQVLHRMVKRYRNKLQDALPDTVDLLGIVLGTGLALDQSMLRVSEEMQFIYPELAAEFSTVVMQVKAGQERTKAFQQLVRRTGIEDIKSLSAMIVQSERFGTSLSQALKVYADSLRTRRRLRAEAAVGKAGIKMLFPIVLFILPALFVITLVPGILTVLRDLRLGLGPR
ncbi:MAG TPA: type II secretion system F family protein [Bryobacteraceae bacterium]|jgi:tight adherence protein C|nr:type II secretion system F family protein [Bryobacteraceae bacterium]